MGPMPQGGAPTRAAVFPLMERPGIAALLAAIAGALNAWSLAVGGTFATVQSGNVVVAGYALAQGDVSRAGMALAAIACFGLGAFVSSVIVTLLLRRGRAYSGAVLLAQTALLLGLAAWATGDPGAAPMLTLGVNVVAGSQGNAFHRDHGMLYGNVAVTFVVQSLFGMLGRVLLPSSREGRAADARSAAIYAGVLVAFAGGAAAGFFAQSLMSQGALWLAAAVTALLGVVAVRRERRGGRAVDPSQNAPTP